MHYDVYKGDGLIYSTDAPAHTIALREGEALHVHGNPQPLTAAQWLAVRIDGALLRIDTEVDAIYGAAIGNRQAEYEAAERQAQAYADADYTGTVPGMVSSWASAKGWTGQQAADEILLQATQWRGAQDTIRAQRLLRKEQVRAAADAAGVDAVMAAWVGFVAAVRQQLGLPS